MCPCCPQLVTEHMMLSQQTRITHSNYTGRENRLLSDLRVHLTVTNHLNQSVIALSGFRYVVLCIGSSLRSFQKHSSQTQHFTQMTMISSRLLKSIRSTHSPGNIISALLYPSTSFSKTLAYVSLSAEA